MTHMLLTRVVHFNNCIQTLEELITAKTKSLAKPTSETRNYHFGEHRVCRNYNGIVNII